MPQSQMLSNCKLVIIIDDNEVDSFIAQTFIKESGFTGSLKLFTSAPKALIFLQETFEKNMLRTEDILIFLDLHMPEVSGLYFLSVLRETMPFIISRVCILSSEFEEIQRKVVNNYQVSGFISKPFNLIKLRELLNHNSSPALEA